MKLLAPTPGARNLVRTLSSQSSMSSSSSRAKEEDDAKLAKLAATSNNQNCNASASKLLMEHKKALAEQRAKKVLYERQMSAPKLGRGFSSGDTIDLSTPPSTSKAKAKALAALKGKEIAKVSPNHVPARKRKAEEVEKAKKKVRQTLAADDDDGDDNAENDEDAAPYVTKTGEVMTKERMERIRNAKSINQRLVEAHEDEETERVLDRLEKKEAMEEKMLNTTELETKAVTCKRCGYTAFSQSDLCKSKGHHVKVIKTKKRFFECTSCRNRTVCLDRYPGRACTKCGESGWARCGMARERRGPLTDAEKLSIRGVERKFVDSSVAAAHLNLDI